MAGADRPRKIDPYNPRLKKGPYLQYPPSLSPKINVEVIACHVNITLKNNTDFGEGGEGVTL